MPRSDERSKGVRALDLWAGRRESEDLLGECVFVGICFAFELWAAERYWWRMSGRRAL
jgi:DNA-binding transcriptional regulator/RsmH inhibitor MraZ